MALKPGKLRRHTFMAPTRSIFFLGLVSFFTDISSEMIYPLLPIFLASHLGAGPAALGVIEGVAESTAALLKYLSGVFTDRMPRRKPLIALGYGISGLFRPLMGLAGSWPAVALIRFFDRVGKGLRTSPRDALIADITSEHSRGQAYGFHRAMDNAGAVVGPLLAAVLLMIPGVELKTVFLASAVPALIAFMILLRKVEEPQSSRMPVPLNGADFSAIRNWKRLPPETHRLLLAVALFTLGNATDAFFLLRFSEIGLSAQEVVVLWAAHSAIRSASSWWGGGLSDRWGERVTLVGAWFYFAIIYGFFAFVHSPAALVALFLGYGLYFGLGEPAERAFVARLAPPHLRGTAFGVFHFTVAVGALPSSLLFGIIWQQFGHRAAFGYGAILSVCAAIVLLRATSR